MKLPADLVNRALDDIGADLTIGSMNDGTKESEIARRHYGTTLRQLLRTAYWNFARKQAVLELLADMTGQNPNVPSTGVDCPWTYAYAWPVDGVAARWMPWLEQQSPLTPPPTTAPMAPFPFPIPSIPARFLVTSSNQFPLIVGQTDWDSLPDLQGTEGAGLIGRRIILTDVPCAQLVYTKLTLELEEWDPLFEQAMVAMMAAYLTMSVIKDKKLALAMRKDQVALARGAVMQARVANGNDAGFPLSTDHMPDWIRGRRGYGGFGGFGGFGIGPGVLFYPWESFSAFGAVF